MSAGYYKHGDWNAICDQCGCKYKATELVLQWDNARVCRDCLDPRHPQDFVRPMPDPTAPPWTRPDIVSFEEYTSSRVIDGALMDSQSMG